MSDGLTEYSPTRRKRNERLRKRLLSREPAFQVGDIVGRSKWYGTGVVCTVNRATADVSWYGMTDIVHGFWTGPEMIPLDQLELVDAGPYPSPANGDVTTLQQSDISMARMVASAVEGQSLDAPGSEMRWVQAHQLGREWKAGDIVRRFSRPAEPGAKGIILGQIGVICGGDKGVVQVSWFYRDEHGEHWQNLEAVPLDQLVWFRLVGKESGSKTTS